MPPSLSIVIPTHKRAKILAQCLQCLHRQTIADRIEVIVVSDGHDPETAELFAKIPKISSCVSVQFLEIPKSQQGRARNAGVKAARSPLVLFIGDDIFLERDACEKHLHISSPFPISALGHVTWDPSVGITSVMRWLERSGWQFGYPKIRRYARDVLPLDIQHLFTYTSHLSLPTAVALAHPFREDLSLYGWEDIEWGMRLRASGIRLFYASDARALHHHRLTLEESLHRMEVLGTSARLVQDLVPGFDRVPSGWKLAAQRIQSLLPTLTGKHRRAFLRGMASVQQGSQSDALR